VRSRTFARLVSSPQILYLHGSPKSPCEYLQSLRPLTGLTSLPRPGFLYPIPSHDRIGLVRVSSFLSIPRLSDRVSVLLICERGKSGHGIFLIYSGYLPKDLTVYNPGHFQKKLVAHLWITKPYPHPSPSHLYQRHFSFCSSASSIFRALLVAYSNTSHHVKFISRFNASLELYATQIQKGAAIQIM